jgi:ATP adenylyltransferase/5',5'''-P-1,P-4-tetraphosphate phosphorylase II
MLPRSQEFDQCISIYTLSYAGSLCMKDQTGLDPIHRTDYLKLLREVPLNALWTRPYTVPEKSKV